MNSRMNPAKVVFLARWLLGGMYLYMGAVKALHPADFLVALRQYHLIGQHLPLNLIAIILPWLEIFCGVLLLTGVAVRGTALLSLGMLVGFSAIVLVRALAVQHETLIPFCAIRFDCGCGGGEVFICRKLTENFLLILLSCWVLFSRGGRWCAAYHLVKPHNPASDASPSAG
jgi:uncharacterized membrane protein YphA (DoxX/SURF4 family)